MGIQGDYAKYAGGNSVSIPANVLAQMLQNLAPQKNQAKDFAPGSPLLPYEGVVPVGGPRVWAFAPGININANDRTLGMPDVPSFAQLRSFAQLYSGITLCERVILDMIPRLEPKVIVRKDAAEAGANEKQYQSQIKQWMQFVEMPDPLQRMDIHTWLRMAWTETTQIDALSLYKQKDRAGRLMGLNIIDGTTVKPLMNERGMIPQPPYPAYQQYPYGVPGDQYTTDQVLYYRESPRSFTPYGFSRVERIILEVNQALRKKNKDLARYTEGNVPSGIMEVPDSSNWTPDQIDAYEQAWNSLLAGNQQQQVRIRFTQPGMKYTRIDDVELNTPFDEFLLNVAAACYGLSMGDLAFTASIHKSADEGQQNMMFRRTLYPMVSVYAKLFTLLLRESTGCDVLEVCFTGYEEAEDLVAQSTAYGSFVQNGILSPAAAARLMSFPEIPETGPLLVTKGGIVPLASFEVGSESRKAQDAAQLAGLQLAASGGPQQQDEDDGEDNQEDKNAKSTPPAIKKATSQPGQTDDEKDQDGSEDEAVSRAVREIIARVEQAFTAMRKEEQRNEPSTPEKPQESQCSHSASQTGPSQVWHVDTGEATSSDPGALSEHQSRAISADYRRWREIALKDSEEGEDDAEDTQSQSKKDTAQPNAKTSPSTGEGKKTHQSQTEKKPGQTSSESGGAKERASGISLATRDDFRRWRDIALKDIKSGKLIRSFASDAIDAREHAQITEALARCTNADEVRAVFKDAQEREAHFFAVPQVGQSSGEHQTKSSLIWRNALPIDSKRS
jgi:hypothetical protein